MSFFGKNIRKIRQLKSYSQQEIADLIGIKRGALSAYEEGRSEPKINTIIETANYFSIPIDHLLTKELTVNEILNFNSRLTVDESLYRKSFPKIPLINKDNFTEYLKYHNKNEFIANMVCIYLPVALDEEYRAFQVQDLEMSYMDKGLFPKDIVVGKAASVENIVQEKLCIIVSSAVVVRKVSQSKQGVILKANHPAIDDEILQVEDIMELWEVVGSFQFHRDLES